MMSEGDHKSDKKRVKAEVKTAKAKAAEARARAATPEVPGVGRLPAGVGVLVERHETGSSLVVNGLDDRQVKRLLPHVTKEVMIAVTADKSAFRAAMMRFIGEGLFQTFIKVLAGLIVGYLLLRFGLR
jgi:hypothetical protein